MNNRRASRLLVINTGSSSLKAALYRIDRVEERLELAAEVERIGRPGGRLRMRDGQGAVVADRQNDMSDHGVALQELFGWLEQQGQSTGVDAVGHRVVHGGSAYREPRFVSDEMIAELSRLVPIDPTHLPQAIAAIEAAGRVFPSLPQVACFDTAFHRHMPPVAQMYALPEQVRDEGVRRYGFHGLSYEYILQELRGIDSTAAEGRVIIAHLGNGASMAAVRGGKGIETTMGFTPSGGLIMGTRAGDLDPGVLLYLLEVQGMSPVALNTLLNQQSGLLGISGSSADMHDLLQRESSDPAAAEAINLFCYQARKYLGALTAVLGGLDTLVFTGGIGEHSADVRERICANLEFLSIRVDAQRNGKHAAIISGDGMPVTVRVMQTNEDLMIARHTHRLLTAGVAPA